MHKKKSEDNIKIRKGANHSGKQENRREVTRVGRGIREEKGMQKRKGQERCNKNFVCKVQ